jgi:hypothetical protein
VAGAEREEGLKQARISMWDARSRSSARYALPSRADHSPARFDLPVRLCLAFVRPPTTSWLAGLSKSPLIAPRCVPGVSRRTARSSARRRIVPFYS